MRIRTLVLLLIGTAVLLVPVAFVGTFLLAPFWGWLEGKTGIEMIGHSGAADWCFLAVYGVLLSFVSIGLGAQWRSRL